MTVGQTTSGETAVTLLEPCRKIERNRKELLREDAEEMTQTQPSVDLLILGGP